MKKVEKCFKVINELHSFWHEWATASILTDIESPYSIIEQLKSENAALKEQHNKILVEYSALKEQHNKI